MAGPLVPLAVVGFLDAFFGYFKKAVYIGLISSTIISIATMYGAFIVAFVKVFNLINDIFSLLSNSSGGALCQLFGLLNCMGFSSAFNDTKSIWLSAIAFLLGRILYVNTFRLWQYVTSLVSPVLLSK